MNVETLTEQILRKMSGIGKVKRYFFTYLVVQWLYQRGRYCFDNLVRQGFLNAMSYRKHFSRFFDFQTFNRHLILEYASNERVLCFDPSYISKSGKYTEGLGYFWSGCAQSVKKGLEIASIAVVDVKNHTAFHLFAVQTILKKDQSLMDFYVSFLLDNVTSLLLLSPYLAVDSYFAKTNFITPLTQKGLHIITRLRDDASLWYPYKGQKTGKKGRPTKYAGKVNLKNLDFDYVTLFDQTNKYKAYEAILFSKSLKKWLKVVVVEYLKPNGSIKTIVRRTVKIYASTDINLAGQKVWKYYQLRFQEEFLFRDAKQFLGLTHCQSRQKERLHFQVNFSLTIISLAKIVHWLTIPIEKRPPFSIQNIKTQYVNEHLLNKFITGMGICPITAKNNENYLSIINYAKIAA
jgi:Transposase DDE domain